MFYSNNKANNLFNLIIAVVTVCAIALCAAQTAPILRSATLRSGRNYRLTKCWADGFAAGGKKSYQIRVIELDFSFQETIVRIYCNTVLINKLINNRK